MAAADVATAPVTNTEEETSTPAFRFPPKDQLKSVLLDLSKPIAQRMRAIFYLRTIGGDDAVEALCQALRNKEGTCLFRHEIAYVLGQMTAKSAIPTLSEVLQDTTDDPIVRHESGEALGAIADPSTLPLLERFCDDARPEVAETCQIASRRVKWVIDHGDKAEELGNMSDNPFESVDPAPAEKKPSKEQVPHYAAQLLDQSLPLFERYKAMFSLRNNRSKAAVLALCKGLQEDPSPLFRHEVAYVLGQLAHPASAPALMESVNKEGEHEMVRHEAAEALGAIGTEECVEFLEKFANDGTVMLKESCIVAIDAADYWASSTDDTKIEGSTATAVEAKMSDDSLISEDEKRAIDAWIEREGRDKYGGNSGTVYAGGNPLFDMKTGRSKGRYSFIVGRHPDRPWMIGGSSTASGGGGASGGSRDLSGSGASR